MKKILLVDLKWHFANILTGFLYYFYRKNFEAGTPSAIQSIPSPPKPNFKVPVPVDTANYCLCYLKNKVAKQ